MGSRSIVLISVTLLLWVAPAHAQRFHRQTFEESVTALKMGMTDDPEARLLEHSLVNEPVHSGKLAERLAIRNHGGTFCFVEYPCEPSLVFEELTVTTWVHVNRPGLQIMARVLLPKELDPKTQQPVELLLRGERYEVSNRWRKLVLSRPDHLLEKQQQFLQAERKRKVDVRGAYIDRILFDVHSGVGDVIVHIDDLHVGPMVRPPGVVLAVTPEPSLPANVKDEDGNVPKASVPKIRERREQFRSNVAGETLRVGDRPFFLKGIVRSDAPIDRLRELGCNSVFLPWPTDQKVVAEAEQRRLRVVPVLPILTKSTTGLVSAGGANDVGAIDETALFYYLGTGVERRHQAVIEAAVDGIRQRDGAGRPVTADVKEGFRQYSRVFDLVGASRFPLATSLELDAYRTWLAQRKRLAQPGTLFWTLVQTEPDPEYAQLAYGHAGGERFAVPVGPLPEQLRLLAYASLAAGYRGIVYAADWPLAESALGRDRMLQLALLNLELMLIEPFIAGGATSLPARTSHPAVAAVAFRHERGVLVLLYWNQAGSQFVVGQAAVNDLNVVVENAPESAQAFSVALGEVRGLKRHKDLGGTRVVLPEFDTAGLLVLTTDASLYAHYQELVHQLGRQAADWQRELAEIQLARTELINAQLELGGQVHPPAAGLLTEARQQLEECRTVLDRGDVRHGFVAASRCLRSARMVRRLHWERALAQSPTAVSDPFLVSFYTLPEHHQFQAALKQAQFGDNQTPSGDFEQEGNLDALGWTYRANTTDDLAASAMLVGDHPMQGRRCLELGVFPAAGTPAPAVVENTRVEMISPPVAVTAGQVVRISGFVRLPKGVSGSVDGAMIWDSLGGQSLALRFTAAGDWKPFVLFRPVHQSGSVRVHLATTGIGGVQYDQLRIELADNAVAPLAGQARMRR